jgi:hypothetical protein
MLQNDAFAETRVDEINPVIVGGAGNSGILDGPMQAHAQGAWQPNALPSPSAPEISRGRFPTWIVVGLAILVLTGAGFGALAAFVIPDMLTNGTGRASHSTRRTGTIAAPPSIALPQATVRVRIQAIPATAELLLNGERLPSNPYVADLPRGPARHLVVRAEGYVTQEADIPLDDPQSVSISLAPLSASAEASP